jgi:hypothetical protein
MTSPALDAWRSSRLVRLDRMLAAHPDSACSPTDPALAREWSDALVLRLAAEFQGFCRDLHDNVIVVLIGEIALHSRELSAMLATSLLAGRGLDRRSADPKTIGDDFERVGSDLWASLAARRPGAVQGWREGLNLLHRARNGVAHDDADALVAVETAGWPVQLPTVRRWRNLLDEFATALDHEIVLDISELVGRNPWE